MSNKMFYVILGLIITSFAGEKYNLPFPMEIAQKIFIRENIIMKNEKFHSPDPVGGVIGGGVVLNAAGASAFQKKRAELDTVIASIIDPTIDVPLLKQVTYNTVKKMINTKMPTTLAEKDEATAELQIKIGKHGLCLGSNIWGSFVYTNVPLQLELYSKENELLWKQIYIINKKENSIKIAKEDVKEISIEKFKVNVFKGCDKMMEKYKENPELIEDDYKKIVGAVFSKFFVPNL